MYNDILGPKKKDLKTIEIQCPKCKKTWTVFKKLGEVLKKEDKLCAGCAIDKLMKDIAETQPMQDDILKDMNT